MQSIDYYILFKIKAEIRLDQGAVLYPNLKETASFFCLQSQ
jgi:hypothetical protein